MSQSCVCAVMLTDSQFNSPQTLNKWTTGVRGLTRGLETLSQGKQEPLVVKDKIGILPGL